ncbi:X-ray repair cross-complementing protein 5 [Teleopsis dalmanni]|uniref:X-ray repair cross-complementing protein 5 n=1 Tax=Teleopsis dalmanni TaxID=139649 RepID=UPI0018CF6C62|nr:X-ray repair cross-complementing protein 5 [Teleopsis dalmanni]
MAWNKECVVLVLDVRENSDMIFKQNAVKCAAEFLKDKMCAAKTDLVSFVLVGTSRTFNDANNSVDNDGYQNIVQYPEVQVSTWQLLMNLFKYVNEEVCDEGNWLDALVVAAELIKNQGKLSNSRIILFYDFNGQSNEYDKFDIISKYILTNEIGLTVISHNIKYIDNEISGAPQAVFTDDQKKNKHQLQNEEYALRLVSHCNAKLCNFTEALSTILKTETKRPWSWNCNLSIGSKISIAVQGVIAVKEENKITLKKCYSDSVDAVSRAPTYFLKDTKITPLDEDLIDGYMLAGSFIPFDEPITEEKETYTPGLKFLSFTKQSAIPSEYFCTESLYWIVHKKNAHSSAKMLDALVKALLKTDMALLCWKIYSVKFNNPKLVVLLPNKLEDNKPASLSMVELAFHTQYNYWEFPPLCSKKTECTKEQIEAIDKLIDSMDLTFDEDNSDIPRETFQKDLLPFDTLPHIFEKTMMDILERKVLSNAGDEIFQEILNDKNFVDVYWKVPDANEVKAKKAAKLVKELFPLETATIPDKKSNQSEAKDINTNKEPVTVLDFDQVGIKTPAADFMKLLKHNVLTLDHQTLRDTKYNFYVEQIQKIIWDLVFSSPNIMMDKVIEALKTYRTSSKDFLATDNYNNWIRSVRDNVKKMGLFEFWEDVIVKYELGLCIYGEPSLEEQLKIQKFYAIKDEGNACEIVEDIETDEDT